MKLTELSFPLQENKENHQIKRFHDNGSTKNSTLINRSIFASMLLLSIHVNVLRRHGDAMQKRKKNGMVVKQLLRRKRAFYYRLVGFLVMAKHLLDSH